MRFAHTVAQIRAAEQPLLEAGVPLMARASTALAIIASRHLSFVYGGRVVLLGGGGNNGADALHAGASLARRGVAVVAIPVGTPVPDALEAFLKAGGRIGTSDALAGADLVLDGLVGIGAKGPLRPEAAELIRQITSPVIAVDVPSGVDADTGAVSEGALRADLTVTFGSLKPGLLLARDHVGELELVDLGLRPLDATVEVLQAADVAERLPTPERSHDKYSRGVVGVAAGSPTYPGAAVLSVGAAIAAGAGMVRFAGAPKAADLIRQRWPEAVVTEAVGAEVVKAGRVQAWVVGPGLGTDDQARATVEAVLSQDVPVLVDAGALTICSQDPDLVRHRQAPTLLTPHDREFARFGHDVGNDRLGAAKALAADLGVHVLLKGDATIVVGPDGPARINTTGSALLATAGSGDVLAGAVGALLAQGLNPTDAASVGAWLHGTAAIICAEGTSASRLVDAWSRAVQAARTGDSTA